MSRNAPLEAATNSSGLQVRIMERHPSSRIHIPAKASQPLATIKKWTGKDLLIRLVGSSNMDMP